jgi:hypothetical protein
VCAALLAAVAAFGIAAALSAPSAQAICQSSSGGCLPGSGYTLDVTWNCGVLASGGSDRCYYNATKSGASAITHTFGWGSSDYDGGGSTSVGLDASTTSTSYFGGWGTNILRSCYNDNCNDQSGTYMRMSVFQSDTNGAGHTIYGHGKA